MTEAVVLLLGLLVYRIASVRLGDEGFALYALCRRTHSFIAPALLMGSGVAIPRFIASSKVYSEKDADSYYKASLYLVACSTIIFVVISNLFSSYTSALMFGSHKYSDLVGPLSVLMAGYMLHLLVYSYFRGHSRMVFCNLLQLVNIAFAPLIMMYFSWTAEQALLRTGLVWTSSSLVVLIFFIWPRLKGRFSYFNLKEVIAFGVQRVPADFGAAALFGLPATITAHTAGVVAGGYVAFSVSLLNLSSAVFGPIGLVMLPKASTAAACRDCNLIRLYIKNTLIAVAVVSSIITLIFEFASIEILSLYLGRSADIELISAAKLAIIATIPYSIYISTRSLVDSVYLRSINSQNIFISLVVFFFILLMCTIYSHEKICSLISLVVALYALGIATLVTCYKIVEKYNDNKS